MTAGDALRSYHSIVLNEWNMPSQVRILPLFITVKVKTHASLSWVWRACTFKSFPGLTRQFYFCSHDVKQMGDKPALTWST